MPAPRARVFYLVSTSCRSRPFVNVESFSSKPVWSRVPKLFSSAGRAARFVEKVERNTRGSRFGREGPRSMEDLVVVEEGGESDPRETPARQFASERPRGRSGRARWRTGEVPGAVTSTGERLVTDRDYVVAVTFDRNAPGGVRLLRCRLSAFTDRTLRFRPIDGSKPVRLRAALASLRVA